jgi:hypothetical protein
MNDDRNAIEVITNCVVAGWNMIQCGDSGFNNQIIDERAESLRPRYVSGRSVSVAGLNVEVASQRMTGTTYRAIAPH